MVDLGSAEHNYPLVPTNCPIVHINRLRLSIVGGGSGRMKMLSVFFPVLDE